MGRATLGCSLFSFSGRLEIAVLPFVRIIGAMSVLLTCRSISKTFGPETLFEALDFSVSDGERLGIIGPNGAGKSTFLKILAGLETADEGEVAPQKGLKLAYVPQMTSYPPNLSVSQIVTESAKQANVHNPEASANKVLGRVGFSDPEVLAATLSGGWRKRLTLACGLVTEPQLMLLDEPTNHLDIPGFLWLEQILESAPFAWIMVTHDRYFLERTTRKISELAPFYPQCMFTIEGPYKSFLEKKIAWLDQRESLRESLSNKVRRESEWLARSPKARTTKSKSRVDEAQRLIEELNAVRASMVMPTTDIDFSASDRKTKKLVETKKLCRSFDDKTIVNNLDLRLSPGQRLGILGGNGAGKTTILRLLAGELAPNSGAVYHAPDLKLVYFEQNRDELDPEWPLKRALSETGDSVIYKGRSLHVMSWARRFSFTADQLPLPVGTLSGGEQARLLIARLMLRPADVLFLDEPTNDLDIRTLEVLEAALMDFPGALVLVTHDRYMLSRVCNRFVGLTGNGGWQLYGDYNQWEREFKQIDKPQAKSQAKAVTRVKDQKTKKLSYMDQREWDGMEEKILEAEERLEHCKAEAHNPEIASDGPRLTEAFKALEAAQKEVERLYERWAELEALQE